MKKTCIVVGGGIGGLATANILAKKGYAVTVLEKNESFGGKASVFEKNGFTFDMGPSWYLMPEVFERYFNILGKNIHDYLKLQQLDPNYRIYHQGIAYDITTDREQMGDMFESWEKGAKEKFEDYMQKSAYAYEVAMNQFVYKNYDSLWDFFSWKMMIEGTKLSVFSSMEKYVSKFFQDDRIRKILQYSLVFLGGSPKNTPALYNIMSHVDLAQGVWYPMGGMGEIPKALMKIGDELGVTYISDADVVSLMVDEQTARCVKVRTGNDQYYEADHVVINGDIHHAETHLLKPKWRQYTHTYWEKKVSAPSAFILYLGLNKKVNNVKHHTLVFAQNWDRHFEEIFDRPMWPDDPSYYLCCPSKTDSMVAPEGMENIFVLVPIAPDLDDSKKEEYAEHILTQIEKQLGESLRDHVVVKEIFTVSDFKKRYHAYRGSALGFAHTLMQTALFRPRNYSKKIKNLYYVGADTVPGIGVPMCLISSELVTKRIVHE